jgi:hypothetical protein
VASAVVGLVLFDDTNPALWTYSYWPVRELLPAAIAFSIGGAVLLRYHKARWPAGTLLICGLLGACPTVCRTLVGHDPEARRVPRGAVHRKRHRDRPLHWALADGTASALP